MQFVLAVLNTAHLPIDLLAAPFSTSMISGVPKTVALAISSSLAVFPEEREVADEALLDIDFDASGDLDEWAPDVAWLDKMEVLVVSIEFLNEKYPYTRINETTKAHMLIVIPITETGDIFRDRFLHFAISQHPIATPSNAIAKANRLMLGMSSVLSATMPMMRETIAVAGKGGFGLLAEGPYWLSVLSALDVDSWYENAAYALEACVGCVRISWS